MSTRRDSLETPPHGASAPSLLADDAFDARAAMDALGDAVAVLDAEFRLRFMNASWERILGVSREDALGRDFWEAYPAFRVEPGAAMIRTTLRDGATRRFDLETTIHGELRAYGVRVARDGSGALVLAVSRAFSMLRSARDQALEDRNEENASLRTLARQMSEVPDSTELLALLCDAAAAQCRAHGACVVRASGREAEVVAAVGLASTITGVRFSMHGSLTEETISTRDVAMVEDYSHSHRPLAELLLQSEVGPMLTAPLIAHDQVLGVLAVMRDLRSMPFTAREGQRLRVIADHAALALWKQQLFERAQEGDAAKGRFLATISHEFRTPLTALTGYQELLTDQAFGTLSDAQLDIVDRMRAVTQHLSSMIEEVLAYTSLEAGREVVRPTDFLASDLVTAVAAVADPLARARNIALVSETGREAIRMTSDVDKARQVLVNLAGNAVKFTERGEVRLSVLATADEVHFAVRDTGIGIAAEDMENLFQPFQQLDTGLTRRYGGTGLGLYISQRLASLLGGRIDVESEPGRGSTFTLVLPRDVGLGGA